MKNHFMTLTDFQNNFQRIFRMQKKGSVTDPSWNYCYYQSMLR